jgi:hypothetical protein
VFDANSVEILIGVISDDFRNAHRNQNLSHLTMLSVYSYFWRKRRARRFHNTSIDFLLQLLQFVIGVVQRRLLKKVEDGANRPFRHGV